MKHFTIILLAFVATMFAGCKQQNNYLYGLSYFLNFGTFYYEYHFDKETVKITGYIRVHGTFQEHDSETLPYKITSPTSFYIDKNGFNDKFEYNPNTDTMKSLNFSYEYLSRKRPE